MDRLNRQMLAFHRYLKIRQVYGLQILPIMMQFLMLTCLISFLCGLRECCQVIICYVICLIHLTCSHLSVKR